MYVCEKKREEVKWFLPPSRRIHERNSCVWALMGYRPSAGRIKITHTHTHTPPAAIVISLTNSLSLSRIILPTEMVCVAGGEPTQKWVALYTPRAHEWSGVDRKTGWDRRREIHLRLRVSLTVRLLSSATRMYVVDPLRFTYSITSTCSLTRGRDRGGETSTETRDIRIIRKFVSVRRRRVRGMPFSVWTLDMQCCEYYKRPDVKHFPGRFSRSDSCTPPSSTF